MTKRLTSTQTARVIGATVRIEGTGGQGVLVPGPFILTATHCINWNGEGAMALGDESKETVTTRDGKKFRVTPLAADPVSDLAVLGPLDDQVYSRDQLAFEEWCYATKSVIVRAKMPQKFRSTLLVQILTHEGTWISGEVSRYGSGASGVMYLETDEEIKGGTSGGPVVDTNGQLVGIISHSSDPMDTEKFAGMLPIAPLALPVWAWLTIKAAQTKR